MVPDEAPIWTTPALAASLLAATRRRIAAEWASALGHRDPSGRHRAAESLKLLRRRAARLRAELP